MYLATHMCYPRPGHGVAAFTVFGPDMTQKPPPPKKKPSPYRSCIRYISTEHSAGKASGGRLTRLPGTCPYQSTPRGSPLVASYPNVSTALCVAP